MTTEQWITINGFENYSVSNMGNIKNKQGKLLKPYSNGGKYWKVKLVGKDGKSKQEYVHRLVASAFLPKPEGAEAVNHKDNCPDHNFSRNLEWVTTKENNQYKLVCKFFSFEISM